MIHIHVHEDVEKIFSKNVFKAEKNDFTFFFTSAAEWSRWIAHVKGSISILAFALNKSFSETTTIIRRHSLIWNFLHSHPKQLFPESSKDFSFLFSRLKESRVNWRQLRICFQREKIFRRSVTERLKFKFPRFARTRAFHETWSTHTVFDTCL